MNPDNPVNPVESNVISHATGSRTNDGRLPALPASIYQGN